jgi:hypothetical protein
MKGALTMAEKGGEKGSGRVLPSHSVVKALRDPAGARGWQDPPDDVIRLVGYIGQSPEGASKNRLYHRLSDLAEYIEFRVADMVHHEEVPEASLGPGDVKGAQYVWIRKDAMVTRGRIQSAGAQAGYIEGEITLAHLRQALRCLVTGDEKSKDIVRNWVDETPPC